MYESPNWPQILTAIECRLLLLCIRDLYAAQACLLLLRNTCIFSRLQVAVCGHAVIWGFAVSAVQPSVRVPNLST